MLVLFTLIMPKQKKMNNKIKTAVLALSMISALSACDKELDNKLKSNNLNAVAFVKLVHVAPGFRQVFNTADTFNWYIDKNKESGATISYNSGYPALTSNINTYATVPAGDHVFRLTKTGNVAGTDPVSILEFPRTLEAGQKYSLLLTDSIIRNSSYDNIWLEDNFSIPDTGKFSLRFVNALMNDTAGAQVDVYSKRYASNIFSNVPVKGVVEFMQLPYTTLSDTLLVRRAGTENLLTTFNTASFSRRRVYTLVYKGSTLLPSSNAKGKNLLIYNNY